MLSVDRCGRADCSCSPECRQKDAQRTRGQRPDFHATSSWLSSIF
nr:MAG TPA_asm: hypothetical protein [Caudoviricetes sp.]